MLKNRLIPVLLLKQGLLVRSELFSIHQTIGNPIHEVERFNQWNIDELIYLDITSADDAIISRSDTRVREFTDSIDILRMVSKTCFVPLTWGGGIKSIDDMGLRFLNGADKISINSEAVRNPDLISQGASKFGSQAIVVSVDVKCNSHNIYEVYIEGGKINTGLEVCEWVRQVEQLGAGEILLQSIDRDGVGVGYDNKLIEVVSSCSNIPLIACSGVGDYKHFVNGINAGADAVAAANIFHFKELSDRNAKRTMKKYNLNIRELRKYD